VEQSVQSNFTYSRSSSSSNTHPPPFSKHRDRDSAQPFTPFGGAHTTHHTHHLCRLQVPEAGPRLKPAGQQTVGGQQKGQGREQPVASLTRLLGHLIRPLRDLLRAVSSSCNLSADWRAGGSTFQESLGHCETILVHFYDDFVSCLSYFAMAT
jgi:hypothetical protein